jgi:hypothetical protein
MALAVVMTRQAISPRLAMRILENKRVTSLSQVGVLSPRLCRGIGTEAS